MNIIHTIASLVPEAGGPSRTVPPLCDAMVTAETHIEILTLRDPGHPSNPILPKSNRVGMHFVDALRSGTLDLRWVPLFRRSLEGLVHNSRNAIIHDNGLWEPVNHVADTVARRQRLRLAITTHGMLAPWSLKHRAWKKKIAWALYQRKNLDYASLLHATSLMEVDDIRRLGLRHPIAYVPNGIPIPTLKERTTPRPEPRVALFLSRIHPVKGLLNLVKAWSIVKPEGWKVVIVGPDIGGHQSEVEALIRNTSQTEVFEFKGPVEDAAKQEFYDAADLFLLPSFTENFGLVVAEALASGLPVIATTGTPWAEVQHRSCGWWVEPTPDGIAEALREATSLSDTERVEMGKRGRQFAEANFSWPHVATSMLDAYHWMLGEAEKPDCVFLFKS